MNPYPAPTPLDPASAALVAEACGKSSVVWVRTVASPRHQLAWHVWSDGALLVISGGGEQNLPMLTGQVEVVVPSKESRARLVTFLARADILPAHSPEWEAAADALAAARLNAHDATRQRDRWSAGALLTRLVPEHVVAEGPGDDTHSSLAAPPPPSDATTVTAWRPWHARGRATSRRDARRRDRG